MMAQCTFWNKNTNKNNNNKKQADQSGRFCTGTKQELFFLQEQL